MKKAQLVLVNVKQHGPKVVAAVAALAVGVAQAALDTATQTKMTDAETNTALIAAAAFSIALGIVVFKWFRRAL